MARKKQFLTSTDVRRELASIYHEVKHDRLEPKKAETLKGILNSIQISITGENKEKEIKIQEQLAERLEKVKEDAGIHE